MQNGNDSHSWQRCCRLNRGNDRNECVWRCLTWHSLMITFILSAGMIDLYHDRLCQGALLNSIQCCYCEQQIRWHRCQTEYMSSNTSLAVKCANSWTVSEAIVWLYWSLINWLMGHLFSRHVWHEIIRHNTLKCLELSTMTLYVHNCVVDAV